MRERGSEQANLILSLDVGTTYVKAALVDRSGLIRKLSRVACPSRDLGGGRVEINAEEVVRALDRSVTILSRLRGEGRKGGIVVGVALSTQRSTAVVWDAESGKPVAPALSWQDSRTAPEVAKLEAWASQVQRRTGLRLSPHYAAPKIRHILSRRKEWLRSSAQGRLRAGTLSSFLLSRLLPGKHLQDHTNGQRTLLMNLRTLDWDPFLLKLFKIPRACLGLCVPALTRHGRVRRWGMDLPLLAVLGDQQAAALAIAPSPLVNYGTGAFVLMPTGSKPIHRPGLLATLLCSSSGAPPLYALEGSVQSAGSLLQWSQKVIPITKNKEPAPRSRRLSRDGQAGRFPPMEGLDARVLDRLCLQSRGSVFCVPSPHGLASPRWEPSLPAAFPGMRADTAAADLFRALTESIAFSVQEILNAAGKRNTGPLFASGSLAQSNFLLQAQADLAGSPVLRSKETEASLLGAARACFGFKAGGDTAEPAKRFSPGKLAAKNAQTRFRLWSSFLDRAIASNHGQRRDGERTWPELGTKRPILIGHRGYRARFPENTLASFKAAYKAGAKMIETDLQLSQDGVPGLMHDDTLDRTTEGRGPFGAKTWKALRKLEAGSWFDPHFKGEKIPGLDETLRAVPPGRLVYLEIKSPASSRPKTMDHRLETALYRLCDSVCDGVLRHGFQDRALIASFDPRVFRYVKWTHPELRTGLIYSSDKALAKAEGLGFQYLDVLCPRDNLVNRALMIRARAQGLLVFSWTIKNRRTKVRLAALGLDGLVQDEMRL